ncbi:insulinoma-associated protein 1-like [Pomacea canaliculata]|uniref:insulinoma-associated protein 1-like n=1 Tax=Pomacea canaliculata TaxID=400727 RepID=UPI000D72B182|nr:insulinoma-associated protein 1-like [Pomacea canaliculata]
MPRGFLVKRSKHLTVFSYRDRRYSDDERCSDSGSELDSPYPCFGSPDSGYSASPVALTAKEKASTWDRENSQNLSNAWSPMIAKGAAVQPPVSPALNLSAPCTPAEKRMASPRTTTLLTVGRTPGGNPSPLAFTAFDTLSLCADKVLGSNLYTPSKRSTSLSPAPNSPSRKRTGSGGGGETAEGAPGTAKKCQSTPKKPKAARKINFDIVDTTSPVSGTIIRELSDSDEEGKVTVYGDIEPSFNVVEITPEARAELEKIENKLGDYICQLCKEVYEDAFQLAQHRCSRIVHVEYRCPECDKVFNCPANLASHRRWHKPRPASSSSSSTGKERSPATGSRTLVPASAVLNTPSTASPPHGEKVPAGSFITGMVPTATTDPEKLLLMRFGEGKRGAASEVERKLDVAVTAAKAVDGEVEQYFGCDTCGKKFRRQAYLRKHTLIHLNGGAGEGDASTCHLDPCQVCGKILLNENARAKHDAEHVNQQNNNVINNNNNSSSSPTTNISSPAVNVNNNNNNNKPVPMDNNNLNVNYVAQTSPLSILSTHIPAASTITPTSTTAAATKVMSCAICGLTCAGKVAMDKHVRSHARETFPCKYCDNTFFSSPGLTRHINKCHPTENRQVILLQLPVSRPC